MKFSFFNREAAIPAESAEAAEYSQEVVQLAGMIKHLYEGNQVAGEPNAQYESALEEFRNLLGDAESSDDELRSKAYEIARLTE